ncbi:MAG: lipopolysaccharide biosynthesis protein [Planctomycetaceae bacterium]|nr:lipopolysaccharide biosynthesis protein [Planctomycetaceae bacterium]
MKPVRDLLKHSSIYMIGQILTRMASVLLLPFYTHVLTPADYGVTAILDLTAAILATLIAGGMNSAITRHHFDDDDEQHRDQVWWTAITMVTTVCTVISLTMYLGRHILADVTLGPEIVQGPWFYTLTILTLWFCVVGMVLDTYLRVRKWSGIFVAISLCRLILNITLNVWLIVGKQMGVEGLLIGNLLATVAHTAALGTIFVATRGRYCLDRVIGAEMYRFAAPLVVTAVTTMMMHEADRYFLRIWVSMDEVGVYSLAHKIGFAVNTLCLLPFMSIWHVAIYDIERMPDSQKMFGKIFGAFVSGLGILLLGASLSVHPVLPLLTPDAYGNAIDLISVILAGFFVFGLSFMFEVPALLSKQTRLMVPGSIAGLVVNVVANILLIPRIGAWGAAWAGVLTYAAFSFTVLASCRTVMKIEYPWKKAIATVAGLTMTYVAVRYAVFPACTTIGQLAVSVAVCALWAIVSFGRDGLEWWMHRQACRLATAQFLTSEKVVTASERVTV